MANRFERDETPSGMYGMSHAEVTIQRQKMMAMMIVDVIIVEEMMILEAMMIVKAMMNTVATTGQMCCCYECVMGRW